MNKKINIAEPLLGEEEWLALQGPIESGWLTQGPRVKEFEQKFAELHGVKHAIATTSCTTALHLGLVALGIQPGDEVIVPAFTWIATANVVLYCGATPVFCDVDLDTYNINVDDLKNKITSKTKCVIPVHLFGLCANIDAIKQTLPDGVFILEDAACATGASYNNHSSGSLGDFAAFSFHPRKSITTGEGGMLTTNNSELAAIAEKLRNHGAEIPEEVRHLSNKPYLLPEFNLLGFNYRMTDLQASVGIVQLTRLKEILKLRQQYASVYTEQLADVNWLKTPILPEYCTQHAWQAFVCYVDENKAPMPRNDIMEKLQAKGIATRPGTHALHIQNYYKNKYSFTSSDFPNAYRCDRQSMAIPLHNKMSMDDINYVINELKNI